MHTDTAGLKNRVHPRFYNSRTRAVIESETALRSGDHLHDPQTHDRLEADDVQNEADKSNGDV